MSRIIDRAEMVSLGNGQFAAVRRNHNLDTTGGAARMAAVEEVGSEPIWHGLGKRMAGLATAKEMFSAAGLNFKIEKWPLGAVAQRMNVEETAERLYRAVGKAAADGEGLTVQLSLIAEALKAAAGIPVDNRYATVRDDSKAILGVVSDSYRILQNEDAFKFMDSIVGAGEAIYDTAGSLAGGAQMWLLARLPQTLRAGAEDEVLPYALLVNGHDGKTAIKFLPTTVRVVCQNTKNLALNLANGRDLTIHHAANLQKQVAAARQSLGIVRDRVTQHQEEIDTLVRASLTEAKAKAYFERIFPKPEPKTQAELNGEIQRALAKHRAEISMTAEGEALLANIVEMETQSRTVIQELLVGFEAQQERATKRHAALLETLMEIYHAERNQMAGARDSLWSAYNAVTEYADHGRHHNGEGLEKQSNRVQSAWFGSGAVMKETALQEALEMSAAPAGMAV